MICKNCGHKVHKNRHGKYDHLVGNAYLPQSMTVCTCGCSNPEPKLGLSSNINIKVIQKDISKKVVK